ncbi:MAG: arsenate reductase ArsC [Thermoplasmatota archaeon]
MSPSRFGVLFACVGNSGRSIMAEAFARHWGGDAVDARSGGSRPLGHVLPTVILAMAERGIDVSRSQSKGFDEGWVAQHCALVVTMGCGEDACPAFVGKPMRDWDLPDPKGLDVVAVRPIRDAIEAKVLALLEERGMPIRRAGRS